MDTMIQKVWGYEEIYISTDLYSCKSLHIFAGYQSSTHHHLIKDETFLIKSGIAQIMVDNLIEFYKEGDFVRIYPGKWHWFRGLTRVVILEVGTKDDPADSIRNPDELSRYVGPFPAEDFGDWRPDR